MATTRHMEGATRDGARLLLRDAADGDMPALLEVRDSVAVHGDRIRDARGGQFRYLVAERDEVVVGFGQLVFEQPPTWPAMKLMPTMIDLEVRADRRSRGIGSFMIRAMEELARQRGHEEMFISTDPDGNARALALYARLGYAAMQAEPYLDRWAYTSSNGELHTGAEWIVDMRKALPAS